MKLPYADARRIRLEGRKACFLGYPRISRFRALGPAWCEYDKAWLAGYDEVAAAPHAAWFRPDGSPWRCGQRTKTGKPCAVVVDRRGYRCAHHYHQPVQP